MPRPMRPSPMKPTFSILLYPPVVSRTVSHAGPRTLSTKGRLGGRYSADYGHTDRTRVDDYDLPEAGLTPESAWMFAPCVTTNSVPSLHVFNIAVASRLSSSRRSLNTKALLNAGSMSTGPRSISFAVSTQRHHGELTTLVKDMPFALICAPIATASARPLSLRFL